MAADRQIEWVASVSAEFREALEQLFFFNARQEIVREGIRASVEQHGVPEIQEQDGRIWIGLPSGATQCLFACDRSHEPPRLAGVVVYSRPRPDALCITHLAVDPDYAADGGNVADGLGVQLIAIVRQIARRTNGVVSLQLPYRERCYLAVSQPKTPVLETGEKVGSNSPRGPVWGCR